MKSFLEPTVRKILFSVILFLVIPMFGTIKPACLAIGLLCDPYFGFIGVPVMYIFGGLIDLVEVGNRASILSTNIIEYINLLISLLPYVILSYVVISILFLIFRKKNSKSYIKT